MQGATGRDARGDAPMLHMVTPPVASRYAIERVPILERSLQQSAGTKVVLVRAPAGYRKTTTLGQLPRQRVAPAGDCAWGRFDKADNDVSRFVASV
jgi:ATP/maltotriose-dependent transcriptional regulator MalT